jgi:hypothetical protein
MNRASIIALAIGAMLFGCGAGMVAHEVMESEAVAQTPWTGQLWEYAVESTSYMDQANLDTICDSKGAAGWELASVNEYWLFFKRPLPGSTMTIKSVEAP